MRNNFVTTGCKTEDEVTAAEGTYDFRTVKHHYSFLRVDRTSSLLKKTFLILIRQKSFSVPEKRRNPYQGRILHACLEIL